MSEQDDDFAALFEASAQAKRFERGQPVEGVVVAIGPDVAFIDVGGKGEAVIDLAELRDESGTLEVAVGDRIHAVVVATEGALTLSRRLARRAAGDPQLEDAFRSGLPVEGKVDGVIKGGYEVRIGRHRAFCPASQIDVARTTDPAAHVGHVYTFRLTEYKEGGRNLVVSRRALLEEEQRARATAIRRGLVPGAVVTGRVVSIVEFGAFVDLGAGVQGLLHVSEMAWSRVPDIQEVVKPGDEITVKVLRRDEETGRIALSLKELAADPWSTVAARYREGQVVTGRVTRIAQFGAFVELEPGVEGLVPLAEAGVANDGELKSTFSIGADAQVVVLDVDPAARRIRLSRKAMLAAGEAEEVRAYAEREDGAAKPAFGSLADKLRDAFGSREQN